MSSRFDNAIAAATASLVAAGDPLKAPRMAAYMKNRSPFLGVQKPGRAAILKTLVSTTVPLNQAEFEQLVSGLWNLPHREQKYLALEVAVIFDAFHIPASFDLFERLITEGAWWDLVDHVATRSVGPTVINYPAVWKRIDRWIESDDMWLRRSAIICQVKAKTSTDRRRLARYCMVVMSECEFFIRKAIGWALREYARTDPSWVRTSTLRHRESMSALSYREATKHL